MGINAEYMGGATSAGHEVKPWSKLFIGEADVVVEHGDPANEGEHDSDKRIEARSEKWNGFVAVDVESHADYKYKYFLHIKNDYKKTVAVDVLVPSDSHN